MTHPLGPNEELTKRHPHPTPGCIAVMLITGVEKEKSQELVETNRVGKMTIGLIKEETGVRVGIVLEVSVFEGSEEAIPYGEGTKVWFPDTRGLEIDGFYYVQFQNIIAYQLKEEQEQ